MRDVLLVQAGRQAGRIPVDKPARRHNHDILRREMNRGLIGSLWFSFALVAS
jgi:hypothetical protein